MKPDEASSTALLIAASLCLMSRSPRTTSLVPIESRTLGDWLLGNYSTLTKVALAWIEQAWFRTLLRGIEALTLPGVMVHYAHRKRAIERLFREKNELSQFVVFGAGFDSLALRLAAELPHLVAWEIDHPATQGWKIKAVAACHFGSPRLRFSAHDLAHLLGPDLLRSDFQRERETFWVAEGLLMYLPCNKVEEVFRFVRQHSPRGSRFAFTYMEPGPDGRVDFRRSSRLVKLWLSIRKEPFAWGIRREDLPVFLSHLGFHLIALPSSLTEEMDRVDLGEYLALAETM